jgi:putative ATPase
VAVGAAHAVEHVGLPECQFALAQAAIYLSLAPKSNAAARSIGAARAQIRDHGAEQPPAPLRSAAYPGAASLGRGRGYEYPHDRPGHVNAQEHLPEGLEDLRLYLPDDAEADLRDRLERIRRARGR